MQPITNPYIEANAEYMHEQAIMRQYAHKITIFGIYMISYNPKDYEAVETFCKKYHIDYKVTELTPGIEEDCEYVTRLPAFHIYIDEEYEKTFFKEDSLSEILVSLFSKKKKQPRPLFTWWPFPKIQWKKRGLHDVVSND